MSSPCLVSALLAFRPLVSIGRTPGGVAKVLHPAVIGRYRRGVFKILAAAELLGSVKTEQGRTTAKAVRIITLIHIILKKCFVKLSIFPVKRQNDIEPHRNVCAFDTAFKPDVCGLIAPELTASLDLTVFLNKF